MIVSIFCAGCPHGCRTFVVVSALTHVCELLRNLLLSNRPGVSGLDAETVLFGRTVPAPLPDVVGYELVGQLNSLATSTDLVLTITKVHVRYCFVHVLRVHRPALHCCETTLAVLE